MLKPTNINLLRHLFFGWFLYFHLSVTKSKCSCRLLPTWDSEWPQCVSVKEHTHTLTLCSSLVLRAHSIYKRHNSRPLWNYVAYFGVSMKGQLALSACLPVCSIYAAVVDCRARNSTFSRFISWGFLFQWAVILWFQESVRNWAVFWSILFFFFQRPVNYYYFLSMRLLASALFPFPPSSSSFFPISLWQMSVVRGHVFVIRWALPQHSALFPVSNLQGEQTAVQSALKTAVSLRLSLQMPQLK